MALLFAALVPLLLAGCEERGLDFSEGVPLAITFDDLPWTGGTSGIGRAAALERTDRLIGQLESRGVPAVGLVTCENLLSDGAAIRRWRQAGFELGNHSFSHRDLNRTDPAVWLSDVRECDDRLHALTRDSIRWFRYPLLHEGATTGVRDSVARALARMGYRNAHVTIDNSEWVLARAYDLAVRRADSLRTAEIANAYVDHLVDAGRHFRSVARNRFGRETGQVLLLHANRLAADHVGTVIDALVADGFVIRSLPEVMTDPIFLEPDGYAGPRGLSWLYRVEPAIEDDPWDERAEAAIAERVEVS
ncbi:MAG: polysaccharide deacetylase family protein [Gemmatimonadota bacterium]